MKKFQNRTLFIVLCLAAFALLALASFTLSAQPQTLSGEARQDGR